jgi:D-serine deaminase-like pyridoxal phosphate-dependent protein
MTMPIEDLDTPVLVIDADALERNIARMRDLAAEAGVAYRPHAKSHKSPALAQMQLDAGARGICCAKLGEAEVMAAAGIPDILITSEVVGRSKLQRLVNAAQQSRISVVADDADNISDLAAAARTAGIRLDVLVEIDVGQGRCGVPPGPEAARLARLIGDTPWLRFKGLQGYQGAIQMTAPIAEREAATRAALDKLAVTAEEVRAAGIEIEVLTGGGTGTSVIDVALAGLSELQPGSYIFMDSRYALIEWTDGHATPFENALTVLGTVISRPAADRCIVDVGYKAASSDGGPPLALGLDGATFSFAGDEHGQLQFAGGTPPLAIGDQVRLVPSHCDTTVNLYDQYVVTSGDRVEAVWEISARGRVQ